MVVDGWNNLNSHRLSAKNYWMFQLEVIVNCEPGGQMVMAGSQELSCEGQPVSRSALVSSRTYV